VLETGCLRARVDACEVLGAETVIHALLESGEKLVASLRGIHRMPIGEVVSFGAPKQFVHVFGADDLALTPMRPWIDDYLAPRDVPQVSS
jgi:TOBE domain